MSKVKPPVDKTMVTLVRKLQEMEEQVRQFEKDIGAIKRALTLAGHNVNDLLEEFDDCTGEEEKE